MNDPNKPELPANSSPPGRGQGEGATKPHGQFLVYSGEDGRTRLEVRLENETVWLTQQHMAELFQTTQQNISLHLQNIYKEGELQREATHKEFLSVRPEGDRSVQRRVDFYNLDAIISVGYRVKSAVATRFRIWATQKLREFIVKGFVLDDERLKNPDRPFDFFEVKVPPLPAQRRIADILSAYDELIVEPMFTKILSLFHQIQNLCRTRDLLLPGLLSGEVELMTATKKESQI